MPGICAVVLTPELCTHEKLKQANWNLLKMQKHTHLNLNLINSQPVRIDVFMCVILMCTVVVLTTTPQLGEPVPEENLWTLRCKGRLTEANTLTIRLGAIPSRLTSAHFHHTPIFLQAGCPACRPTNRVKALKASCGSQYITKHFC